MGLVWTLGELRKQLRSGRAPELGAGVLVGLMPEIVKKDAWSYRTQAFNTPSFPPSGDGQGFRDDMNCWSLARPVRQGAIGAVTIGRAATNDVVMDHPSVSKLHARLHLEGDVFRLEDCESANGTTITAKKLVGNERRQLENGTVIGVGQVYVTYFDGATLAGLLR